MPSLPRTRTSYMAHRDGEAPAEDDLLLSFVPVPHSRPRRNSITATRQRAFIAALAASGIVTQAASEIGASLEALYKLRQRPGAEGFRAAWDAAVDRGVQRVEDCALERAIEGEKRMVVSGGKVLGFQTYHNERLVMFFLRQRRPARYALQDEIGPGHPVYEKIAAAYEEARKRERNDPKQVARIRKSIDVKVAQWRQLVEADWHAERQAWIASHGGEIPHIDSFPDGIQVAEPTPESAARFYAAWTREDDGEKGEEEGRD